MPTKRMIDTKMVDKIVEKMIETVDHSKDEIFLIGEQSRQEFETLADELKEIQRQVLTVISEGDKLEVQARLARNRLSEVSGNFNEFSEDQIRSAYERAHGLQMELSMVQQKEKQLRERRDDIERRLLGVQETIDRAEHLVGQISVVLNYLNSDIKQMGAIIEDARQKQEFGLKIIEAQEEERKRLSREIHDGPAQMLANVMMRSQLIDKVFRERGPEEGFKDIADLRVMVRSALYEVRRIIYDLRPMALDDLGLVPTLKKYLETIEEYNNSANITFINLGIEKRLLLKYEVALFRLVQEAVQNALKHANAKEILVKVQIAKTNVTVIVKDNGDGFDVKEKKRNSFGLMGMRERVELLEGQITIDTKKGAGTVIMIQVPIQD
ncbi:sensor histidine kinase [Litchfieldia salsa]|uniref:Signal transduction histidine-protein kinase/phosphatase DegS n=1 Tax=Litchfieldia salsa TaxID=930152 RepID=A0A1H0WW49_9BACI|nr:sensor histidine kinase [Litchfieldia salsa]SDP94994.1 two-component system, NarL family, sensor histidine kinase DegS [Litchfieldia salsa]